MRQKKGVYYTEGLNEVVKNFVHFLKLHSYIHFILESFSIMMENFKSILWRIVLIILLPASL